MIRELLWCFLLSPTPFPLPPTRFICGTFMWMVQLPLPHVIILGEMDWIFYPSVTDASRKSSTSARKRLLTPAVRKGERGGVVEGEREHWEFPTPVNFCFVPIHNAIEIAYMFQVTCVYIRYLPIPAGTYIFPTPVTLIYLHLFMQSKRFAK